MTLWSYTLNWKCYFTNIDQPFSYDFIGYVCTLNNHFLNLWYSKCHLYQVMLAKLQLCISRTLSKGCYSFKRFKSYHKKIIRLNSDVYLGGPGTKS